MIGLDENVGQMSMDVLIMFICLRFALEKYDYKLEINHKNIHKLMLNQTDVHKPGLTHRSRFSSAIPDHKPFHP